MKKIDAIGLYHIGGGLTIPRCNLFSLIKRKFPLLIEAISYSDSRKFVVQIGDSFDIRTRMISREYFLPGVRLELSLECLPLQLSLHHFLHVKSCPWLWLIDLPSFFIFFSVDNHPSSPWEVSNVPGQRGRWNSFTYVVKSFRMF